MRKQDLTSIRGKTITELERLAADLKSQIIKADMELTTHKSKNTNMARNLHHDLARVLSIKREKELVTNT